MPALRVVALAAAAVLASVFVPGRTVAAPPPSYHLIQADDRSTGDSFRVVFAVELLKPPSAETARAVAEDIVGRRIKRRRLDVAEVRIYTAPAAIPDPPEALVSWRASAAGGPGSYTTFVGTAAAEALQKSPLKTPSALGPGEAAVVTGLKTGGKTMADSAASVPTPAPSPVAVAVAPSGLAPTTGVKAVRPTETKAVLAVSPPIGAGAGAAPSRVPGTVVTTPLPAVAAPVSAPAAATAVQAPERARVLAMVRAWAAAWEARDLEAYLSHYAADFRSGPMNRDGWRTQKAKIFSRESEIKVGIEDPEVRIVGSHATVEFVQDYRATSRHDRGHKTLVLDQRDGAYRIVREDWKPE